MGAQLRGGAEERVAAALPPGEQLQFAVSAFVKAPAWVLPSMLVGLLLGVVPGLILGVVYNKMTKQYLIALTDTCVHVLKVFRPRQAVAVYPVGSLPITRVEAGKLTTTVYLMLPGRPAPARVVIPRLGQEELAQLVAASALAASAGESSKATL